MGMDLLTIGYTTTLVPDYSTEAVLALVEGLPREWLEEHMDVIDSSGCYDTLEELRTAITAGAGEFDALLSGSHRMGADYPIPGTTLFFTVSGGGSWGDAPYDGWSELVIFIETCAQSPELAEATGFVCYGIPDAATAAAYPKG